MVARQMRGTARIVTQNALEIAQFFEENLSLFVGRQVCRVAPDANVARKQRSDIRQGFVIERGVEPEHYVAHVVATE
jgi:hypothetical protein